MLETLKRKDIPANECNKRRAELDAQQRLVLGHHAKLMTERVRKGYGKRLR